MAKTYLTGICNGTRDTECLKSLTDRCCCVRCLSAVLLDCDCCTCNVCPACILEADRLNALDLIVYIKTSILCNLLCLFKRSDTIAVQNSLLIWSIRLSYDSNKAIFCYLLNYSFLGSIILTASATRPYCPFAFSHAVFGSSPFLMKSVIFPRDTN